MKILVADDDAVSRSMMRRMLVQSGYEVSVAHHGVEAIEVLMRDDGPRLVLLDWMMPELDGPEVCRAIRASSRAAYIYITLLTSKESKEDLVAGLEAGADDYLTKPCNLEELRARLRTGQRILQLEDILVEAREEMRFKATHDALTLLLDRGAILSKFSVKLEESRLLGRDFSIVLCDVDHFKKINDTYGHPAGDEVLREIALRLKESVRDGDTVGRYGGEEFLIILNGCGRGSLAARADNICRFIQARPITTHLGQLSVSISVGASSIDDQNHRQTADEMLHVVDAALYHAKQNGRNRAVTASCSAEVHALV